MYIGERHTKMQIQIPEKANQVISVLTKAGFEAYAVGGCVRDAILGREAADWDITTNARPEEVKALFPRTLDTGLQHGTVTVMQGKEGFEVTTYRVDGEYLDGRHPEKVTFTPSLTEDLKRRDFTINAMAYNDQEGLIDIFDGMGDLRRGQIRCVGDPEERFTEDALRILRAVRFSAQLGFSVESRTRAALSRFAPNLRKVSAERIQTELLKLLVSPHPEKMREVWETGITAVVLPEFDACMNTPQNNPHHCGTVGEHTLKTLAGTEAEKTLRLAALFHDIGKPQTRTTDEEGVDHFYCHAETGAGMTDAILRRLKFDNETRRRVVRLVRTHDDLRDVSGARAVRRAVHRIGADIFPDYLKLRRADILAQNPAGQQEKLKALEEAERLYQEILREKDCLTLKELAVTGRDLIEAGIEPGPALGETLNRLLELVIEEPQHNTKEYLLKSITGTIQPCG